MINESDIVFVTTTLYTKWLDYQKSIIKKLFPDSEHLIINGKGNWPNSWFNWINELKKSNKKYYIHIDEDFFITDKNELLNVIQKMESKNIDIMGCPDGYNHYRNGNPVAFNTFLMFGRISDIKRISINFDQVVFGMTMINGAYSWINSHGLSYKEEYGKDFNYKFKIQGGSNFEVNYEPYYAFIWHMKDLGCKFEYLFPSFDERFNSTNPRIEENSNDIGIHMWYARQWNSSEVIYGMTNLERYTKVENFLNE